MFTPKLILTSVLLLFSSIVFAEHKHHVTHKNHYRDTHPQNRTLHQDKSKQWAAHKIARHYRSHHGSADKDQQYKHQHKQSYHRYPGRTVYRAVKSHSAYRDTHHHDRHDHRFSYEYEDRRHDAYRLIAGTIVLNEVLHHLHH